MPYFEFAAGNCAVHVTVFQPGSFSREMGGAEAAGAQGSDISNDPNFLNDEAKFFEWFDVGHPTPTTLVLGWARLAFDYASSARALLVAALGADQMTPDGACPL